MRLTCPWCGTRDVEEFIFGGDASLKRPKLGETDRKSWLAFVFERRNPKGAHREYWQHEKGCRHWLVVERDTVTHEISSVSFASETQV